MAEFLKKRLQVFVSSTFEDLQVERQAAVMAILRAGHIPAGMELFTAGDESQWEVIKQWIDESDAYFLILGGRYGSINEKSGKSYTQLEYEYAIERKKAVFACVIRDEALASRMKAAGIDSVKVSEDLLSFRSLVLSKVSEFWMDSKDIQLAILNKLGELSRRDDLSGWVRPSEQSNLPALSDELARLSRENSELRRLTSPAVIYAGFTYEEMLELLSQTDGLIEFLVNYGSKYTKEVVPQRGGWIPNQGVAPFLDRLIEVGLMNYSYSGMDGEHYQLKDIGIAFLTKLTLANKSAD